jgi:protein O-GlcNAc transferase
MRAVLGYLFACLCLKILVNVGGTTAGEARSDKRAQAVELYGRAIQYEKEGSPKPAIELYKKALKLDPAMGEAYLNLGNRLNGASSYVAFKQAAQVSHQSGARPDKVLHAKALTNLGLFLVSEDASTVAAPVEASRQAIAFFLEALESTPGNVDTLYSLGNVYEKEGLRQKAYEIYDSVLRLAPMHVGANLNTGNIMLYAGYYNQSWQYYKRALSNPSLSDEDRAGALNNAAAAFRLMDDEKQSMVLSRQVLSLEPENEEAMLNVYKSKVSLADWEGIAEDIGNLIGLTRAQLSLGPSCTLDPVYASLLPVSSTFMLRVAHANIVSYNNYTPVPRDDSIDSNVGKHFVANKGTSLRKKLVVGYVASDFNEGHPTGHLIRGVLDSHDRAHISVHCYGRGRDDGSEQRRRIIEACDVFENVSAIGNFEVAKTISQNGVHIFVDLMAHTCPICLSVAAYRPGAIVVNYFGYPGTIGSGSYAQYIVVDRNIVVPERVRAEISEKAVYLPHHYQANEFPSAVSSCTNCTRQSHLKVQAGIPETAKVVFCNFNTMYKIEQDVFAVWMNILRRVPGSVFWVLVPKGNTGVEAKVNVFREAVQFGVSPSRIIFAKRVKKVHHLDRYQFCDVFLDTFIYGAHSTASEAMWALTPVVTLEGQPFRSRVAADVLKANGIGELVVHSKKAYEDVSVKLGTTPGLRLVVRKILANNALLWPLFDTQRLTQNLDRAYKAIWAVREIGIDPVNIVVAPRAPYVVAGS